MLTFESNIVWPQKIRKKFREINKQTKQTNYRLAQKNPGYGTD